MTYRPERNRIQLTRIKNTFCKLHFLNPPYFLCFPSALKESLSEEKFIFNFFS